MVLDKFGSITVLTKAMKLCSPTVKMLLKYFYMLICKTAVILRLDG